MTFNTSSENSVHQELNKFLTLVNENQTYRSTSLDTRTKYVAYSL